MHNLILIRHEVSTGNLTHTFSGKEVQLSTLGKIRTKKTRENFMKLKLDNPFFLASEYLRAIETAKYTLKRDQFLKLKITPVVNEVDFGDLVGRTFKENLEVYKDGLDDWLKNPDKVSPPGGESTMNAMKRAKKLVAFAKKYDGDVVVFSHEGFIQCVLGAEQKKRKYRRIKNGEIVVTDI